MCVLLSLPVLALLAGPARADTAVSSDRTFGLGIMLGAPSGLSGKVYLGENATAIAFGVGSYYQFGDHDGLHVHGDFLWHPVVLASHRSFVLPFYFGVGARLLDHDGYQHNNHYHSDGTHLGARVPVGVLFDFTRVPLDLFVELVPVWDFIHADDDPYYDDGYDHHHDGLDLTAAVGLRYYF